jgi:colanic acid biosynthesis glycosyl transferase WcaI
MNPRRLLIISQVYVPDPAAVGQHLADVAETMAQRGWKVTVYTSSRGYDDPSARYPYRETRAGVKVIRFPLSSFGKRSIAIRLVAQVLFMCQATLRALVSGGIDAILVSTSPPFAGFFGAILSWIKRAPMTWWVMDINPDQMVVAGKLPAQSLLVRVFDWMNRVTLRRAAAVVTLDDFMAETLRRKVDVGAKMHVIPPWSHNTSQGGVTGDANPFRIAHGLQGRFVVMYAGNHALQHPLDTLLDAAKELESDDRILFVSVGGGAGKASIEQRIAAGATNLLSLPYQPLELLDDCLAAADVHVVSMGNDMVGIVHPCKIYGAMAAGRPILAFAPARSHIGQLLVEGSIGWRVDHGSTACTVAIVHNAAVGPRKALTSIGENATLLAASTFDAETLIDTLCDTLAGA